MSFTLAAVRTLSANSLDAEIVAHCFLMSELDQELGMRVSHIDQIFKDNEGNAWLVAVDRTKGRGALGYTIFERGLFCVVSRFVYDVGPSADGRARAAPRRIQVLDDTGHGGKLL